MHEGNELKLLIVGSPRTGSNLLVDLLDSHPSMNVAGELFLDKNFKGPFNQLVKKIALRFPVWYVQRYARTLPEYKNSGFGFKVFSNQIPNFNQFVLQFYQQGYRLLFLERRNILKQAFSIYFSYVKKQWVVTHPNEQIKESIQVDVDLLVQFIRFIQTSQQKQKEALQGLDVISVMYENDLATRSMQEAFNKRICTELNIPFVELTSSLLVMDTRPDEQRVSNLAEVIAYLNSNGFSDIVSLYYEG
jgi:LPS sulfotransferase NodH